MSGFAAAAFVAHSTALIPEVSGAQSDRLAATRTAFSQLDADLARLDANTLMVVSPHGPTGVDDLPIRLAPRASGHLSRFGAPRVALDLPLEVDLTRRLIRSGRADGFRLLPSDDRGLDHGTIVPLWLLPATRAGKRFVFLGVSEWPLPRLEEFGRWLSGMVQSQSAILLASGQGGCGSRPLAILRGAAAAAGLRPTSISYEDPLAAGCALAPSA